MLRKFIVATLVAASLLSVTPALAGGYLGNPKSMKFHFASCRTIKHPERFVQFDTRDDAVEEGYVPCGVCNP